MTVSKAQRLTDHFYDWEKIGRGWYVFPEPVELEPEFVPFFPYISTQKVKDESYHPNLLESASQFLRSAFTSNQESKEEPIESTVQAYPFHSDEKVCGFSISFDRNEKAPKAQDIEKLLTVLSYTKSHVSFEIMAWWDLIRIQFVCRESDLSHVESQVRAYFPSCIIRTLTGGLTNIIDESKYFAIADFGLAEEFMRPMAMPDKFDSDPLTSLFGVLEHLEDGEQVILQFLFKGTENAWASSMYSSVTDAKGESFFVDAPEMPKLTQEKISAPLFAVAIRMLAQHSSTAGALNVLEKVGTVLMHCSQSGANKLVALTNTGRNAEDLALDILFRRTRRVGMILNAKELSTFVHYPHSIYSKKLEQPGGKTKRAPDIAWGHEFCLGTNRHRDFEGIVTLSTEQRLKHMHVIGATGTGKSTLLQSCIVQDIHLGNGVAVLDPHGDLIESILPYIPENRLQDVILIDPTDSEYPVGFNILTAHSDIEKEILASDLVSVFRRLSTSFGDQMHSVLANAILAFLESSTGGTLLDLRRFLIEKEFRNEFLKTVSDQSVIYYWQKEYPLLKTSSIGPILTRLDSFLRPKLIRNMVAQKKSLDFEVIMDGKKIVLIKLAQGLIGTENSYLLGTFFVSKIYQAAMARQIQSKAERTPFYLYIDEFQNFATPSMSSILSGTRKYGLGCILAHQDMSQLANQDAELANSVVSNAGTRVCFRIGDIDAKRFADGFSSFEAQDIQNLGVGQAIARIERPEWDFSISTLQLNDIGSDLACKIKSEVSAISREKYGTPRIKVEESLEYQTEEKAQKETITPTKQAAITSPTLEREKLKIVELRHQESTSTQKNVAPLEIPATETKVRLVKQKELSEHRYTQMYIKKMAEARGYVANIEQPTPDGTGRVDVLLERNGKRIACEVSMTTTIDWELHNVKKCLAAGYDVVIIILNNIEAHKAMQSAIERTGNANPSGGIMVMDTQAAISYLDKETLQESTREKRVKGYRVRVEYDTNTL